MDDELKTSADTLRKQGITNVDTAIILGSGLGAFVDELDRTTVIPYSEIACLPTTTVKGHEGQLIYGKIGNSNVIVLQGRFHLYEGFPIEQVVSPIFLLHHLGINNLILTTASGGLNPNYRPGDFMLFKDFISFVPITFSQFDFSINRGLKKYLDKDHSTAIENIALNQGIKVHNGVFVWVTGPTYETTAEIEFYSKFGDAISMSTVPSIIAGYNLGMKVVAMSCITNTASPYSKTKTTHQEVLAVAKKAGKQLNILLQEFISNKKLDF